MEWCSHNGDETNFPFCCFPDSFESMVIYLSMHSIIINNNCVLYVIHNLYSVYVYDVNGFSTIHCSPIGVAVNQGSKRPCTTWTFIGRSGGGLNNDIMGRFTGFWLIQNYTLVSTESLNHHHHQLWIVHMSMSNIFLDFEIQCLV